MIRRPTTCAHCGAPAAPIGIVADIQATVAAYYHLPLRTMTGATRDYAHQRQVAMYLCREMTPKSLPEIAFRFNRDHTTVLWAVRAVRIRMARDDELRMDIGVLRARLEANPVEAVAA